MGLPVAQSSNASPAIDTLRTSQFLSDSVVSARNQGTVGVVRCGAGFGGGPEPGMVRQNASSEICTTRHAPFDATEHRPPIAISVYLPVEATGFGNAWLLFPPSIVHHCHQSGNVRFLRGTPGSRQNAHVPARRECCGQDTELQRLSEMRIDGPEFNTLVAPTSEEPPNLLLNFFSSRVGTPFNPKVRLPFPSNPPGP